MIKALAQKLIRCIPESSAKNCLRRTILHFRIGIPRELMVNRGDTVVQVGIWSPSSVTRLVQSIGSTGRLLVIELSNESLANIRAAVAESDCQNITFVNKAVWHTPGEMEIIEADDPSMTRIDTGRLHPGVSQGKKRMVEVDTIGNICTQHGIQHADYMEITINGAEVEAIRGMGGMLKTTRRIWVAGLTRDPKTGEPLNTSIAAELIRHGFQTKISRAKRSRNSQWGSLDGHVYGWRTDI